MSSSLCHLEYEVACIGETIIAMSHPNLNRSQEGSEIGIATLSEASDNSFCFALGSMWASFYKILKHSYLPGCLNGLVVHND